MQEELEGKDKKCPKVNQLNDWHLRI